MLKNFSFCICSGESVSQKGTRCVFLYQMRYLIFKAGEKTNPNTTLQFYSLIISQVWATMIVHEIFRSIYIAQKHKIKFLQLSPSKG